MPEENFQFAFAYQFEHKLTHSGFWKNSPKVSKMQLNSDDTRNVHGEHSILNN